MSGSYLVCPDGAFLTVDTNERPRCRDSQSNSAWELHHTDELTGSTILPPLTLAEGAEIATAILLLFAFAFNWKQARNAG